MRIFVDPSRDFLFCRNEQLARGQGDAIGDAAVKGLRASPLNLRGIGHPGDDPLGRPDRIVLMRIDLWQLVEHRLWQLALFKIVG